MLKLINNKTEQALMETAIVWSKCSNCTRTKVGCVIAKDGRIVSIGYNGTPSGYYDNTGEVLSKAGNIETKPIVIHSEINALMFAAKYGISTNDCTMYITLSPCIECSKAIIQSGIKEVVYKDQYRDTAGIEFLKENNIKVRKL